LVQISRRVLFIVDEGTMVLLHGFKKDSQKTKKADLEVARERKAAWEASR
jgi:phage-related protein